MYAKNIDDDEFAAEVKKLEENNTDWFHILTQDVFSHNHTLSMSGGSSGLRYYFSVGYAKDNDVIKDQGISRYTGNLSLDADLCEWLDMSIDFNGNISTRDYEQSEIGSIDYAYRTSRVISPFNLLPDLGFVWICTS